MDIYGNIIYRKIVHYLPFVTIGFNLLANCHEHNRDLSNWPDLENDSI